MHLNVGATSHKIEEEEEDFVLRTILENAPVTMVTSVP